MDLLPDVRGKSVVDLGCGGGELSRELVQLGAASVVGVDISENMLAVAKAQAHPKIEYVLSDICEFQPVDAGQIDLVVSSMAFHYIENFASLVANVAAMLKPGGGLLFSQEHPILTAPMDGPTYLADAAGKPSHYKLADYARPGIRHTQWLVDDFICYHRSFADICNTLIDSGFTLRHVCEPVPSQQAMEMNPALEKEYIKPNFIVLYSTYLAVI